MTNPSHTFASPFLQLQATPDESTVVAAMPSGSEKTLVTSETNPVTGGCDFLFNGRRQKYNSAWEQSQLLTKQRVFEKFNRIADWNVVNSANTSVSNNSSGRGPYSTNAMRFTASQIGGQNATATKDIKFNLNSQAGFWLLNDTHFRQAAAQLGMTLYASHLAGLAGGSGRFQYANPVYSGAVSLQPFWVPKAGWSTLDGSPSWATDILSWRVRIDSSASESRDWSVVGAFTGGARPTVIITCDDGWDTSYSIGHGQAQRRGIPLSHYLIASLIGSAGYITLAQAFEMRANGDYLGLHGNARWDQNISLIDSDAAALRALGIDVSHAAYPEGQIGDGVTWQATEAKLTANGVKTARLAGGASPTLLGYGDPFALTSYPLNSSLSLANATAAVDTAIASGGTVIFYAHKFGGAADSLTWATADWNMLLDYIYQKRLDGSLDATTIDRWYNGDTL